MKLALPADSALDPSVVPPFLKVTVPVGVPPADKTLAVNVTVWATTDGFGDDDDVILVLKTIGVGVGVGVGHALDSETSSIVKLSLPVPPEGRLYRKLITCEPPSANAD